MSVLRLLLYFPMLFLSAWPLTAGAATRLEAPRVELEGHMALRIDEGRQLGIEEIADPRRADDFVPLPGRLNLGHTDAVAWLRFTVVNTASAPAEWWLEVEPAVNERITLYVPAAGGGYSAREGGASLPFAAREIAYRNPVFKLMVPAGAPQTYYLRIDTQSRTVGWLTLWQPDAFIEAVGKEQIAFGLYLGVFLLLVLASLWFELAMRDRVYLYFAFYGAACILYTLTTTGLWQQYLLPDQPGWFPLIFGFSLVFLLGTCLQFLFHFLEIERQRPRLTRIYLTMLWLFCGFVFVAIAAGHQRFALQIFFRGMFFGVVPSALLILFRPALRSPREIRLALIATILFLAVAYFWVSLVHFHVILPNAFTENAMYLSPMAFCLIVYYSVSRRYHALRMAKEAAQSEALRISQRSEQELELLVAARTEELRQAVQSVEAALAHSREIEQEQRHFIATVSHELRTPLAVIDATAQNLEREAVDSIPKGRARLKKIRQATSRLGALFDDYLDDRRFARAERGIRPRDTEIQPLLQDAIAAAQPLAEHHLLKIDDANLPLTIRVDPHLLRLVLRTLVDNAVKYTPAGTTVSLRVAQAEGGWHVDVADTGPGIAVEERKAIFERYFRGRASSSHIGTGLGLPLARRLIEMHGGTLNLLGADAGGSTFRIFLPHEPTAPTIPAPA